ncbi:MAG TPA: phosphatase PAP2 family protein [Segetibacter sp.]|jgi:membrane-associated phospholipid phosphatase
MKKLFLLFTLTGAISLSANAQDSATAKLTSPAFSASTISLIDTTLPQTTTSTRYKSPYTTSFRKDAPIIAGGLALTAFGTYLIGQKKELTLAELATRTSDKVPFFDRHNLGHYDEKADDASYIPFHASFIWPVAMTLINKNERHNAFQVLALYLETMSITGALFTISAGAIHRSRPYVYTPENGPNTTEIGRRRDKDSQRSFFAGHTAATASASFFTAKVFSDFNPDSKLKPIVWGVAAALPAITAYYRYKGGMHFLSDNLLGYAIGAGVGIMVPELHKSKRLQNLDMTPEIGPNYKGISLTYHIK